MTEVFFKVLLAVLPSITLAQAQEIFTSHPAATQPSGLCPEAILHAVADRKILAIKAQRTFLRAAGGSVETYSLTVAKDCVDKFLESRVVYEYKSAVGDFYYR